MQANILIADDEKEIADLLEMTAIPSLSFIPEWRRLPVWNVKRSIWRCSM